MNTPAEQRHNFARNPPKTQAGWYCQACGYFTPRLDDKERALVCRRAAIVAACPNCKRLHEDLDGFGVLFCEHCKWCSHASISDGRCDFCGNAEPKPIETLDQYHAYIAEASTLVALDPPPDTPEARRLMALVDVIEVFERKEWASMFPEPARDAGAPGE